MSFNNFSILSRGELIQAVTSWMRIVVTARQKLRLAKGRATLDESEAIRFVWNHDAFSRVVDIFEAVV